MRKLFHDNFFLPGFSFTDIHISQDGREKGRLSFQRYTM